jgi:hypothetical protein
MFLERFSVYRSQGLAVNFKIGAGGTDAVCLCDSLRLLCALCGFGVCFTAKDAKNAQRKRKGMQVHLANCIVVVELRSESARRTRALGMTSTALR